MGLINLNRMKREFGATYISLIVVKKKKNEYKKIRPKVGSELQIRVIFSWADTGQCAHYRPINLFDPQVRSRCDNLELRSELDSTSSPYQRRKYTTTWA